jgi:hypothetical protein
MELISNGHFFNPTKGELTLEETIKEIFSYMSAKPEKFYNIIVGCDSPSEEEPHFPLAIVVLRTGEGGRFFLKKIKYAPSEKKFPNFKMRILEEVCLSCQLALELREVLKEREAKFPSNLNYQFRHIHADISETGDTRDMIRQVTGLIIGNGFEPKIKPESYAASVVADRFT